MNIANLSKLSFFKTEQYSYHKEHVCDFRNIPRPHFCMGLLLKGSAVFEPEGEESVSVGTGDIIFVPITSRYISKWHGEPDILYISMHFAFEPSCGISEQNHFALQKVTLPDFNALKQDFLFCLKNYGDESNAMQMATLGVFFRVMNQILPELRFKAEHKIDARIEKATEYISLHSEKEFSVAELAAICNMSVSNFHMQFRKNTSMTPIEYKNRISIGRAMRLLKAEEGLSIEEISEMLGFDSSAYFRRVFKKITGKTPAEYRKSNIEL
ncbi:MAG: AraC family transcriptional regulator [Eubacteriales bacterium]